jgi:hypothetical protein
LKKYDALLLLLHDEKKLEQYVNEKGLSHPDTVRLSQEIDKLQNYIYYDIKM